MLPKHREALIERLYEQNLPRTQEDYIGKEHFRKIGDDLDIRQALVGRLFSRICFPLIDSRAVLPSQIGLILADRQQVGLHGLEDLRVARQYPTKPEIIHQNTFGSTADVQDIVIQAGSLVQFAAHEDLVQQVCLSRSLEQSLGSIAAQLELIIAKD